MIARFANIVLSATGLMLFSFAAQAKTLPGGFFFDRATCFERIYSAAHLKRHPLQKTTMIRFEHFPFIWGPTDENDKVNPYLWPERFPFAVYVRLRDHKLRYNTGECWRKKNYINCQIECDGGGFRFVREDANTALIRNTRGFSIVGCGEEESTGEENYSRLNPKPDDKAFRLYRLPQSKCRKPFVPPENMY